MPENLLDSFGFGVIVLDQVGCVTVVNAAAARLTKEHALFHTDSTGVLRSGHTHLDALLRAPAKGDAEWGSVARAESANGQPVTVWVTRPDTGTSERGEGNKLIVIMTGISPAISVETLAKMLGITQAEARVVHKLMAGRSLMECAREASLSHNTVRNQLHSAIAKTGAGTQTELLLMVQRLVAPINFA